MPPLTSAQLQTIATPVKLSRIRQGYSSQGELGTGEDLAGRVAGIVEKAIEAVLQSGRVTADLRPAGAPATTQQVGEAVCAAVA